jgi:hypothetical protein
VLEVIRREKPPQPPADADERDPQVKLVQLGFAAGHEAQTTALIDYGRTRYTLHVRMVATWNDRWMITDVGPA